jgi:hypothetical protein
MTPTNVYVLKEDHNKVIGDIVKRVGKLEEDMYFGDGKENPPMTTRMDRVEQIVIVVRWMIGTFVVAALAAIGDLVVHLTKG